MLISTAWTMAMCQCDVNNVACVCQGELICESLFMFGSQNGTFVKVI